MEAFEEGFYGEADVRESPGPCFDFDFQPSGLEQVRNWIRKQRFIACDLSDEFLLRFLNSTGQDVEKAKRKIRKYFKIRQEPGPLFQDLNPSSPGNQKLFGDLYLVPLRNVFDEGEVIILTGLLKPTTKYSLLGHIKLFALTIDYLLWDKMNKFTDLRILMDGGNFICPALLENPFRHLKSYVEDFQNSLPIRFRGFYILHPPEHVREISRLYDSLWWRTFETAQEICLDFPVSILPFEFGGSLGHLHKLIDTWNLQRKQRSKFFIQLEKDINESSQCTCHEREVKKGGKNWVWKMKLVADETEYKKNYYEKMANFKPMVHPAYGKERKANRPKYVSAEDPLKKLRELAAADKFEVPPPRTREKPPHNTRDAWPRAFEIVFYLQQTPPV